jgi:hypothetical protein
MSADPEVFQLCYTAVYNALQRKLAADARFNEATVKTVHETLAPELESPSLTSVKTVTARKPEAIFICCGALYICAATLSRDLRATGP